MYAYKQTSYGSRYYESYLGEINNDYNINLTLDGTKDSSKVEICNFDENIITPYTILRDENTDTWWIVKKDRVERHKNENGYFYKHQIELLGTTELLNARDLTDCGFNANRYTIGDSIRRLLKLSGLFDEFVGVGLLLSSSNDIDLNIVVPFTKTYENYTLLSAIRELLDAYNCDLKMTFSATTSSSPNYINTIRLNIYSKTGNTRNAVSTLDSSFTDIRELKELDSNSFGSVVVSNANNVVASNSITFPSAGWSKLTSDIYEIDTGLNENARTTARSLFIRLPSNAFKVNYVDLTVNYGGSIVIRNNNQYVLDFAVYPINYERTKDNLIAAANTLSDTSFKNYLLDNVDEITSKCISAFTWRFYDGVIYNPQTKGLTIPPNAPNDFRIIFVDNFTSTNLAPFMLYDKDQRDHLHSVEEGFYWERGSNKIGGWERFANTYLGDHKHLFPNDSVLGSLTILTYGNFELAVQTNETGVYLPNIRCKVNYIPMNDLKIKIDNDVDTHNVKIYNQTGKLTDGVAFSKRLDSYSKEISSDNITRYKQHYAFSDIYSVGKVFLNNNEAYITNNVSIDVHKHESNYFFDCEYTFSKQIAVKSLMVNPNTNIRDYLIPQNNNVFRKTLFRDYYTFTLNGTIPTNTFNYAKFVDLGIFSKESNSEKDTYFVGIKVDLGSFGYPLNYYYQLSTSRYNLKKIKIYTLNFNDNNIIGYDCQNRWSGFNIQRLIDNNKLVTVPIQYTDEKGEVYDIDTRWCSKEKAEEAYTELGQDSVVYCQSVVFINSTIFNKLSSKANFAYYNRTQSELNAYKKDALEVPFFEYCIQFNDNESVLVGDNILNNYDNCFNIFAWGKTTTNSAFLTQENFEKLETSHPNIQYLQDPIPAHEIFLDNLDFASGPYFDNDGTNILVNGSVSFEASSEQFTFIPNISSFTLRFLVEDDNHDTYVDVNCMINQASLTLTNGVITGQAYFSFNLLESEWDRPSLAVYIDDMVQNPIAPAIAGGNIVISNWVRIAYSNDYVNFILFNTAVYDSTTKNITPSEDYAVDNGSYAIYKYAINKSTGVIEHKDLIMIIKDAKTTDFVSGVLTLAINHYELK